MASDRFARQRLLPEVGDKGQRAIAEASVRLPEGPASAVAADFLARAGVGRVLVDGAARGSEFPHASHFRHAPSQLLGHGAWQALAHLRAVLELEPTRET
jgi:hypothetical protein